MEEVKNINSAEDIKYRIYSSGEIKEGFTAELVRENLCNLFNCTEDKIEILFSGKKVVLKKGVTEEYADRYNSAINQTGLIASYEKDVKKRSKRGKVLNDKVFTSLDNLQKPVKKSRKRDMLWALAVILPLIVITYAVIYIPNNSSEMSVKSGKTKKMVIDYTKKKKSSVLNYRDTTGFFFVKLPGGFTRKERKENSVTHNTVRYKGGVTLDIFSFRRFKEWDFEQACLQIREKYTSDTGTGLDSRVLISSKKEEINQIRACTMIFKHGENDMYVYLFYTDSTVVRAEIKGSRSKPVFHKVNNLLRESVEVYDTAPADF